jgi:hypothetical protein
MALIIAAGYKMQVKKTGNRRLSGFSLRFIIANRTIGFQTGTKHINASKLRASWVNEIQELQQAVGMLDY